MNSINSEDEWRALAILSQKGDKRAYTQLLTEISQYIKALISRGISDTDALDDITQEVLISVHKSLKTYSPDKAFKPWLNAIIQFRKTDFLRKYYATHQDKVASLDILEFSRKNVTEPSVSGELRDIENALQRLPNKQRQIFMRVKIEGYSIAEVAKEMNMRESAVKVSAHRAMKKLQGML